ncbi:MAG: ABC transporter ATP-binding protein [Lachnospiraceae bacterium]|nr:ABC transporter ATP-binding protein [uncultured Acetatifactor sp.]MCI9220170.1 ABC transporter ATP-binding protein [Lachnospiraceae bacterium]
MEQNVLLSLSHVSKRFKTELALKDINMTLRQGEILGFLGPSGAGKTTTIKIITGQLRQTSGEARLLGTDSANIDESIYENIGVVSDSSGIYKKMTVWQNLAVFARIWKVPRERVEQVLDQVGLAEHKNKPAGKLSKGQTQRLVLARAVLHKPRVLFLDEPTSGLDPTTAVAIHRMLLELKEQGMAIFLTTHNMEEATKLCDRVALLHDGEIVEFGSPQEICLKYNRNKKYHVLLAGGRELELAQNPENIVKITRWMEGDEIMRIHSCEPTLETVFLEVTGKDLNV